MCFNGISSEDLRKNAKKSYNLDTRDFPNLYCYGSRLKGLSQETTLVLSNTRELDRVPSTE